jgi:tetratricopeptide (TPR) repeat protein
VTAGEDRMPPVTQNVSAVNGFAYGVIGADVHVFDNGLPLYLLANWQQEPVARSDWLLELPSRMLNARRAVVPFTGRAIDLESLREWRDNGPRLAVRWLHGPGGQGKTRIAAQLAAESAAAGWKVVAAFHGPDAERPGAGSQDLRLEGAAGLLMVADYADRWLLTNLSWLLRNALLHQTGVVTRVLMIARTTDAWPRVRGILDAYQAGTSSQSLPPLEGESGARVSMFTAARDRFAVLYQSPSAAVITAPGTLDDLEYGLTLAVHMAALVAVDAHVTGKRLPQDMAGLTMYLLDREQLHWTRLYGDGTASPEAVERPYRTPPEVMNQAVFTAALTGSVAPDVGAVLLDDLELREPIQILTDHATCYPPGDHGQTTVLEPLYPDRLAEDFLALTMPGHVTDYPAQLWASPTIATLLTRQGDQNASAAWTPRAITFLAAAAHRWPHLGPGYLHPLLLSDAQLAVDGGSAALSALSSMPGIDPAVLEAIEALLPEHRHVDLDVGIAALAGRLAAHRLSTTDDPAKRARIHNDLCVRLSYAGLHHEGLTAAEEAVQIWRQLATADPEAYEADLSGSLNNLGNRLSDLGQSEEALAAVQEAVKVDGRLARIDPVAHAPDLALSLYNLGLRFSQLGRFEEGLSAAQEAVQFLRLLAAADPETYEADLAMALNSLGAILSSRGRSDDAVAAAEEALATYRRLASTNPAAYDPELAMALNNLGTKMSELGRPEEAVAAAQDATTVYRRLARINPAAFERDLAVSLNNLCGGLSHVGRLYEALATAEETVTMYRRLARINPAAFEPDLAGALTNLGRRLSEMGRQEDALEVSLEAARLWWRLAEASPVAYRPYLAMSLNNLSIELSGVGRSAEALAAAEEAILRYRQLADTNPATYGPDLARALLAITQIRVTSRSGFPEALAAIRESVAIYRLLTAKTPTAFADDFKHSLATAVNVLDGLGEPEHATSLSLLVEAGALDEAANSLFSQPELG